MENFYKIYECHEHLFRVFINLSNKDLANKFVEINRSLSTCNKFVLVIEAVKMNCANRSQYNWEMDIPNGAIYAIKVDQHRFYTIQTSNSGYKELYICRYGKKESQENTKKLTNIIRSIENIEINKMLSNE